MARRDDDTMVVWRRAVFISNRFGSDITTQEENSRGEVLEFRDRGLYASSYARTRGRVLVIRKLWSSPCRESDTNPEVPGLDRSERAGLHGECAAGLDGKWRHASKLA